ncbi:MAG TPA: hydantoinase/carbamoylase family amidase, partial [Candidatus Binatia bacterium]|nr:hydantoinase/carbamoylase family amidase [Candidatus Binatia bacterium]
RVFMRINYPRLLADLRQLAKFGQVGSGVHRLSFTPEDREARHWLLQKMTEAGLDARIDGVGNVYGQSKGVDNAVLIGSHTDSVPNGGWLDGAMGVLYGLEIARARREAGEQTDLGIDVISFADEEGTYRALAGSLSFCGHLSEADVDAAKNQQGKTLRAALSEAGYAGRPRVTLDAGRHVAYLEGHIEQGPRLESEGKKIGVVSGIVGIRRVQVTCTGQADHAGTTPMHLRKDAGSALIKYCHDLMQRFAQVRGADSVWNFGHIAFAPGAGNVVPSTAHALVEFRDAAEATLDRMQAEIQTAAATADGQGGVGVQATELMRISPAEMNADLEALIEAAARGRGAPTLRMPSGAGHDAMVLTRHVPTAMLFIPSIGGRSHDTAEDTAEADICLGIDVLADTVEMLAARK